jgi:hypothetical protein
MYQAPDFWLICMFLALHHNKFNNPKSLLPENRLKVPDSVKNVRCWAIAFSLPRNGFY